MLKNPPKRWTPQRLRNVVANETKKWCGADGDVAYIGLEHIGQGNGKLEGVGKSSTVVSTKNTFRTGDVLFGKLRPNLKKFWRAEFDGICSTDILVLRPRAAISSSYLFYLIQSSQFLSLAMADAVGTKMPRTSWMWLGDFEFLLPPPNEQKRIVEILISVDACICRSEAMIDQAKRVKRGLMEDLLTGSLGSDAIARGEVPSGWRTLALGDIASIVGGTTPKRAVAEYWDDGTICWATPTDITNLSRCCYSLCDTKEKITLAAVNRGGAKVHPIGTVLMTSRATIGYVAIAEVETATNQGFANFLPNKQIHPRFLCYSLEHRRAELEAISGGSTFKEISKASLKRLSVVLPPLAEQQRIAEILTSIDDGIRASEAVIRQGERVKHGLMEDLLTGRVRTIS